MVTFDKPGRVDVFCSIHSSMSCVVLVLENPYFATTNDKGVYSITNVPAGVYKLKAWHERLPAQVREITVPESGGGNADFTLRVPRLPKHLIINFARDCPRSKHRSLFRSKASRPC